MTGIDINGESYTTSELVLLMRTLTPREHDVIALVATGLRNREIATALRISVSTVQTHLEHITQKLGVRGRVQMAAMVVRCARGD